MTAITKSGDNGLHGTLFWLNGINQYNARPFFAAQKGQNIRNDMGFTLGGPIIKNKTFYFGSYEAFRQPRFGFALRPFNNSSTVVRGGYGIFYDDLTLGQYAEYWEAPIRQAKAAVLAYSLTKDSTALELADNVITHLTPEMQFKTVIIRSLISDEVEARSCGLSTAIDLYEVTGEKKYLDKARTLADDAVGRFLHRGLFVSSMQLYPEGDKNVRTRLYDARSGAGWLVLNLIRLQRDLDATHARRFKKFDALERIYD